MTEVKIRSLEWHKSHTTPWMDDWHTISPLIYKVRCDDENGWRWSCNGAHGYAGSPDDAKEDAQADFEARIRSAILPDVSGAEPVAVKLKEMFLDHANRLKDEFERGFMRELKCDDTNGALVYGRKQGLEMAASLLDTPRGIVSATPPASDLREENERLRQLIRDNWDGRCWRGVNHEMHERVSRVLQTEGK